MTAQAIFANIMNSRVKEIQVVIEHPNIILSNLVPYTVPKLTQDQSRSKRQAAMGSSINFLRNAMIVSV